MDRERCVEFLEELALEGEQLFVRQLVVLHLQDIEATWNFVRQSRLDRLTTIRNRERIFFLLARKAIALWLAVILLTCRCFIAR